MTDFGLSNDYIVHDGLDQDKVFFLLLWKIFYDSLLCKIKRQEHLCGYRINSNFVVKSGRVEFSGGMLFFFAAGAFVDDTIWVGNGQALTQYILNIAMGTPKQIQLPTWKKQRFDSPANLSYHHTPRSTINIISTATANTTTPLNKILFQSKQKKAELLGTYDNFFKEFKSQSPMSSGIQLPPPQPDFGAVSPWEITDSKEKESGNQKEETKAVTTYLGCFHKNLHQIQAIQADYFTVLQILNQFIHGLYSSLFQHVHSMHPQTLQNAVTNVRDFELAELKTNHAQAVNLVINESFNLDSKLKQLSKLINQKLEGYLADNYAIYQTPQ
ncbi:hypothetical protein G9A89_009974 [Geosiphon pyriformis]|nr:hypothetical protein G9A89_009974 [Geosiphon pyriformis]